MAVTKSPAQKAIEGNVGGYLLPEDAGAGAETGRGLVRARDASVIRRELPRCVGDAHARGGGAERGRAPEVAP